MKLIDMHCDTMSKLFGSEQANLDRNSLCVDLEKLRKADSMAQFFACFIDRKAFPGEDGYTRGYWYARDMLRFAKREFEKYPDEIALTVSYEELRKRADEGRIAAFLTVEEGGIVERDMGRLECLYEEGVRLMTLLWNGENCMGYPNSRDRETMAKGLKPFGIQTVERMNELGMIVDVSHLSDGGFWDVLTYSRKPPVASHSNARALCPHPRNLSDEMIRALAGKGGIAGVNVYPYFLRGDGRASVEEIAAHVEYLYQMGGEDFVAVGSDFDGFEDGISDLTDMGQMERIFCAVKKRGFTQRQLEKFGYGNALRILKIWLTSSDIPARRPVSA